jgi:hypothetical protein
MFSGCKNLTTAPELPATKLSYNCCYSSMFSNCTSLKNISVNFTEWNDISFNSWVNNVSPAGTFNAPEALLEEFGINRIPEGWTVVRTV